VDERARGRELAWALWMLCGVAAAVAFRQAGWCSAAGLFGLGARLLAARGDWTPSGRLGAANAVTLVRLGIVAALPAGVLLLPRVGFSVLVVALLGLDALDGCLARRRGEVSSFGAALDMETDALSVMVLSLLLWQHGVAGPWVLVAGLWRYVYASIIAVVPSLGEAPRSRFGRVVFAALMLCLAGAFLPVPPLAPLLAAAGTVLVSISFLYSFASSRAASDQVRAGGRAA
jgi:phosphatidylglycerophosphate synthase